MAELSANAGEGPIFRCFQYPARAADRQQHPQALTDAGQSPELLPGHSCILTKGQLTSLRGLQALQEAGSAGSHENPSLQGSL